MFTGEKAGIADLPSGLAIRSLDEFVFGIAPRPVDCGHGVKVGDGIVIPEINFTLPPIEINSHTWPEIRRQYAEMIEGILQRAVELEAPGLLVEFETLPPMTMNPAWGIEITELIAGSMERYRTQYGIACALRLTPNDLRDFDRPPRLRSGRNWESMVRLFESAAGSGADLLAIESTGGKEVCDGALLNADLSAIVFGLGVLAPRDMAFLWREMVSICGRTGMVPSGDSACAFANTAMVLAEQKLIPRILAAVVRVASVTRSLVAHEMGATGPSKDCAYEGPYLKAIAGIPISMEGRTSACAHRSPVGNIAQAVCDCWSNESVQNVQLLSGPAPVACLEQLVYDCRLMNTASAMGGARVFGEWLTESDSQMDPQAHVLRPDVVLRIGEEIVKETNPYLRTRRAVYAALKELRTAHGSGSLRMRPNEIRWLDRLQRQADMLPDNESKLCDEMMGRAESRSYSPSEYGLEA